MATRQLVIKTGVVKRLIKEVASYEKEAQDRSNDVDKVKAAGKDDADIRQAERIHSEATKMVPDSTARLNKAAEELRELLGEQESTLDKESKEYKDANEALNKYYELDGGKHVMEAESEPKDLREDDY